MQLLMEHAQKGRVFRLWAKYELLGQERELVDQYDIRRYVLVEGDPKHEKERALKLAAALAVVVSGLTLVFSTPADAVLLGLIALVGGWIGIYYRIRETITVDDIVNGRHFACRSIATLLQKREQIAEMAQKFTQFLEALKNWGGREVIEMAPDRAPIARFVERPHAVGAAK
jgi:hypothetical protein